MPRFKVIQYRDAVIRYEAVIDAVSAQAALDIAKNEDCDWIDCGSSTYDSADMEVHDMNGKALIDAQQVW